MVPLLVIAEPMVKAVVVLNWMTTRSLPGLGPSRRRPCQAAAVMPMRAAGTLGVTRMPPVLTTKPRASQPAPQSAC